MDMEKKSQMNVIDMDAFRTAHSPAIRNEAALEDITFAIGESQLGVLLVARTARGVCAILIGTDAEELESDLATRFTEGTLVRNDPALKDDFAKIQRFIAKPSEDLGLPLDIRGTPSSSAYGRSCCAFHRDRA